MGLSVMSSVGTAIRSVRLSGAKITEILDQLDRDSNPAVRDKRATPRYYYRIEDCIVHLQPLNSNGVVAYTVPTRNLSAGGMAFLNGGFVYTGTRCHVQLLNRRAAQISVEGTVVRCRHLTGNIHEIGIQFDSPINPAEFIDEAAKMRVLVADPDPANAQQIVEWFGNLHIDAEHLTNGRMAVMKVLQTRPSITFLNSNMPMLAGLPACRELRTKGYFGIVFITGTHDELLDASPFFAAGCDHVLTKPYNLARLTVLIRAYRSEPLVSQYAHDAGMLSLINCFGLEISCKVHALEKALCSQDIAKLGSLIRCLKGEGGGYGFDAITEAAIGVENALLNHLSFKEIIARTSRLIYRCRQARASVTQ